MCTIYIPGICIGEMRASAPVELVLQMTVSHMWMMGIEPMPSREQQVLLTTEPSLQPLSFHFWEFSMQIINQSIDLKSFFNSIYLLQFMYFIYSVSNV